MSEAIRGAQKHHYEWRHGAHTKQLIFGVGKVQVAGSARIISSSAGRG